MIFCAILRFDAGPPLPDIPNDVPRGGADLQLLQAAGEQTGVTPQGPAVIQSYVEYRGMHIYKVCPKKRVTKKTRM